MSLLRPAAAARVAVGLLLAAPLLLGGCDASAPAPDPTPPASVVAPSPPSLVPAVGPLFLPGQTQHYCTAAVVDSDSGDLLVTAAHCLAGTGAGLRFVPGYGASGSGPRGSWTVTAAYAPTAWLHGEDPHADYAFLRVVPADASSTVGRGRPHTVEGSVGSVGSPGPATVGAPVVVAGYAAGEDDAQIVCGSSVQPSAGEPSVKCGGLGIGTSGGPWISGTSGEPADGSLVGLIGGLHQGGCTDALTYSPRFDTTTTALLRRADADGPSDALPVPGSDGC